MKTTANIINANKKKSWSSYLQKIDLLLIAEKNATEIESLQVTVDLSDFIHFAFSLEKWIVLVLMWLSLIKPTYEYIIVKLFLLF